MKPRSRRRCLIRCSLSGGLYGTAAASFALLRAEYSRAAQCQNHCRERRAGAWSPLQVDGSVAYLFHDRAFFARRSPAAVAGP